MPNFDAAGVRVMYALGVSGSKRVAVTELASLHATEFEIAGAGESFDGYFAIAHDAESVIARIVRGDETTGFSRVELQTAGMRQPLSDPARSVANAFGSKNSALYLFDYTDGLDLVDSERATRMPLPGMNLRDSQGHFSSGFVHQHAYYAAADGLHLATIDGAGALVDVMIEPGAGTRVCEAALERPAAGKAVLTVDAGRELVFVDVSGPRALSVGRMRASADGASLACPQWEHGGTSLGVREKRATGSAFYLVPWADKAPAAPVLAVESAANLEIYAFMYR